MTDSEVYLSTVQASEHLGISARSLEKWRIVGNGPAYMRLGKLVKYRLKDLDSWAESRLRRSTSQIIEAQPWPPRKPAA